LEWHWPDQAQQYRKPVDIRDRMIRETNAFLSWSLAKDRGLPRIARRRVDQGGFGFVLKHPGARAIVRRWWNRVLSDHRMEI
jgi:hypothetical protein